MKINEICCLDCDYYSLWNKEYCCTLLLETLSETDDLNKALDPERIINNKCDNLLHNKSVKYYINNHNLWKKFN